MGIAAELVMIDDGSVDETWSAIEREVAASEGRVRGVRHVRNKGIVGGWRSGLQAAAGDLVCVIDSDLQNRPEAAMTSPRLNCANESRMA